MSLRTRQTLSARRIPATALVLGAGALACGVAAAALTLTSQADAQQGADLRVVISPLNGADRTVRLADVAGQEDLNDRPYAVRAGGGDTTERVTGFSVEKLLALGNVDAFGFSYAEVFRPGGGSVLLSRHQVMEDGAFPDGPPPVYADGNALAFLRPSSGAGDLNADDSFVATDGVVRLALRTGKLLEVDVTASPMRTKPRRPVSFAASVTRAGAGEALTFNWFFSDGTSGRGPEVTHRFKEPGSYNVVVGVTSAGDSVGASESVRIQVGKPREGPDRTGGGTREYSPLDSGPSSGGAGSGPVSSAPEPSSPQPAPVAANVVEGELISTVTVKPQAEPEQESTQGSGDERAGARTGDPDGGGLEIPPAAWGLLACMGMLGGGAFAELRGVRELRSW